MKTVSDRNAAVLITAILSVLLGAPVVRAQESADTVLQQYIEAVGGKAALEKIKNRVIKGSFSIPDMGMYAQIEMYIAPPDKAATFIDLGSFGSASNGVNGDVVWEINPMIGARILSGADRLAGLRQAQLDPMLNWQKSFTKAELAGSDTVQGKPCTKISLTPSEGDPVFCCFDNESHLLTRMVGSRDGQSMQSDFSDYRAIDGVMVSFKSAMYTPQFSFEVKIDSVQHNLDIPAEKFQLPAEISSMVGK